MEVRLNKKQKVTVYESEDIYKIMQQILRRENKIGQSQEHFRMVGLNQANKILFIELVASGSSNMMAIKPREAFRLSIHKLAVQAIMVHNHPSGELKPSESDKDFTDHFIQAGKFLKVDILDHLIISDKSYYSFVDSGLFEELEQSKKYVLPFELEERAREEGKEEGMAIGQEKGKAEGSKEKAIEMARGMKQRGIDSKTIEDVSGLSAQEIQNL